MSQYRRQIAVGAFIAILSAVGLGLGVNLLLPTQVVSSSSTSTATTTLTTTPTTTSSTATTSSSISSITATSTATSTTTSTSSATTATPTLITTPTVQLDPNLGVSLARSTLLSGNATQIAGQLAMVLGESPVTSTGVTPRGPNNNTILAYQATYSYRTAAGSEVIVTLVQGSFYQLDYRSSGQAGRSTQIFSPLNASAKALDILAGMGLPTRTDRLVNQAEDFSPDRYTLQWGPAYAGVPIEGKLSTNFDGSLFVQGSSVYFEFNPGSGAPTRIILISPYWYSIPDAFPLAVSPLRAGHIAATHARGLGMDTVTRQQVNFVVIHDSLYYVVTVGDDAQAFQIIVNPRTGEVGLPG